VEEGLESALNRKVAERSHFKKLDGAAEAFLVASACSQAPEGRAEWTMHVNQHRKITTYQHPKVSSWSEELGFLDFLFPLF
jgi:hypothetical protein